MGEWLREWVDRAIRPPARRANTYDRYRHVIEKHLIPAVGAIGLQVLKAADVKRYYTDQASLSPATLGQHHAILSGALKAAVLEGLVLKRCSQILLDCGVEQGASSHPIIGLQFDVAKRCPQDIFPRRASLLVGNLPSSPHCGRRAGARGR